MNCKMLRHAVAYTLVYVHYKHCKDFSLMFSSFNFSWNLSSDVSARCSSHPQGENEDGWSI